MFSPLLAIGTKGSFKFNFDNKEELDENPLVSKIGNLNFSKLLGKIDLEMEDLEHLEDLKKLDDDKLKRLYRKAKKEKSYNDLIPRILSYKLYNAMINLISSSDREDGFEIYVDAFVETAGHVELQVKS